MCLVKHHPCLALGGHAIEPVHGVLRCGDPTVFNHMQIGNEKGQAEVLEKMGYFLKPDWDIQVCEEWASVPPLVQEFWWPLSEWSPYMVVRWEVDVSVHEEEEASAEPVEEQARKAD